MSRAEKEAIIIKKLSEVSDSDLDELFTVICAMTFGNEKGLKDYSQFLDEPKSKEGKHLRDEFLNYKKQYPRE
ncbi:hypothetical protein AB9P05_03340 [Roseivirga sp. BDSF3-8]|uniref:hypothetical protein n=1 Tax=Roseivirga sp. BDSF3-8 TaxID=3241598 RepID=UPI0035321914